MSARGFAPSRLFCRLPLTAPPCSVLQGVALVGRGYPEPPPPLLGRWLALTAPPRFLLLYVLPVSRPVGAAPTYAASFERGPPPRSRWPRGDPRPLLGSPAPYGRAPRQRGGLRESGVLPSVGRFYRLTRSGSACGLGATPPRSEGWRRASLWSRRACCGASFGRPTSRTTLPALCTPFSPQPAASSLRSSAPASAPTALTRCSSSNVRGLPSKPLTLRHPRSRPPRGSFSTGTLLLTFNVECSALPQSDLPRGASRPSPAHHPKSGGNLGKSCYRMIKNHK